MACSVFDQPNTFTACNILRVWVADCRGVLSVCLAWHAEDPGIESRSGCNKVFENVSLVMAPSHHLRWNTSIELRVRVMSVYKCMVIDPQTYGLDNVKIWALVSSFGPTRSIEVVACKYEGILQIWGIIHKLWCNHNQSISFVYTQSKISTITLWICFCLLQTDLAPTRQPNRRDVPPPYKAPPPGGRGTPPQMQGSPAQQHRQHRDSPMQNRRVSIHRLMV